MLDCELCGVCIVQSVWQFAYIQLLFYIYLLTYVYECLKLVKIKYRSFQPLLGQRFFLSVFFYGIIRYTCIFHINMLTKVIQRIPFIAIIEYSTNILKITWNVYYILNNKFVMTGQPNIFYNFFLAFLN